MKIKWVVWLDSRVIHGLWDDSKSLLSVLHQTRSVKLPKYKRGQKFG